MRHCAPSIMILWRQLIVDKVMNWCEFTSTCQTLFQIIRPLFRIYAALNWIIFGLGNGLPAGKYLCIETNNFRNKIICDILCHKMALFHGNPLMAALHKGRVMWSFYVYFGVGPNKCQWSKQSSWRGFETLGRPCDVTIMSCCKGPRRCIRCYFHGILKTKKTASLHPI